MSESDFRTAIAKVKGGWPTGNGQKAKDSKNKKIRDAQSALELIPSNLSPSDRGSALDFYAERGARKGELDMRQRLRWLRTLSLGGDAVFVSLIEEAAIYSTEKNKYSSDLLGLVSSQRTTQLAIVECKARNNGDNVLYAVLEGIRNALLWNSTKGRKRLDSGWRESREKAPDDEARIWHRNRNTFPRIDRKNCQVLIIGDHSWIQDQDIRVAREFIATARKKVTRCGISIYSTSAGRRTESNPYKMLPLKKWL